MTPRSGVTAPVTYASPHGTSPRFGLAFARGCGGGLVRLAASGILTPPKLRPGPFAAFCTPPLWPLLQQAIAERRDWYYGDHGYYRRGRYYRITKNAYQYIPPANRLLTIACDRLRACGITPEPRWRRDGRQIVVCPNSAAYLRHHGQDAADWSADVIRTLAQHTDRPVTLRWKTDAKQRPLAVDLADAWAVVVFTSNAAVEALCAGVPIFVTCPWASTASMGLPDLASIEMPYYPDSREAFLADLAYHQWTLAEITAGLAWRALNDQP